MEFNPARPENMQRTDVRFTCTYPSHAIVYFLFWYIPRLNVCGTLHEGSNTFYMNLRTFPSIFELRGCLRLPTVACWLPYAAEAHPFDIWWRRSIYRSRMPNTLDWPTFRSNIQVNICT